MCRLSALSSSANYVPMWSQSPVRGPRVSESTETRIPYSGQVLFFSKLVSTEHFTRLVSRTKKHLIMVLANGHYVQIRPLHCQVPYEVRTGEERDSGGRLGSGIDS